MFDIRRLRDHRLSQPTIAASMVMVAASVSLFLVSPPARAIPAFAHQMGVECTACHTAYPQPNAFLDLTAFRRFPYRVGPRHPGAMRLAFRWIRRRQCKKG